MLDRSRRHRMRDRLAMYNANALKIGLFGANCSSGRSATKVPERWSASWPDCLALARMADAGRHRLHAADRPLEGLRRRHRPARRDAGDHDLGDRAARRDRAHHRVRHRARAAVPSDHRRQAMRHRRPRRPTAASASTSSPAGTRASSRCSACSSASTRRATNTPRTGSTPSSGPGARRRISTSTASYIKLKKVRAKPKPYGGTRPLIMNAGSTPTGQAFALRNCDAFFTATSESRQGGVEATKKMVADIKARGARARPRDRGLHRRPGGLPADPEGGGGLLPLRHHRAWPTGARSTACWRSRTSRRRPSAPRNTRRSANISPRARSAAIRSSARPTTSPRSSPILSRGGMRGIAFSMVNYLDELPYLPRRGAAAAGAGGRALAFALTVVAAAGCIDASRARDMMRAASPRGLSPIACRAINEPAGRQGLRS